MRFRVRSFSDVFVESFRKARRISHGVEVFVVEQVERQPGEPFLQECYVAFVEELVGVAGEGESEEGWRWG